MTDINTNSDAYNTGYEAAKQGESRSDNPYAAGTWDSDNWLAGYDAAK
jgi:ribosome modulation factor